MSLIFSITGSIACGKSTVSNFLRSFGIPIVDADQVARDVVVPDSIGLSQVINTFGEQYLQEDGTLNRSKLANFVFSNQDELDKLNHIMAPLIEKESIRQINLLIEDEHELCCYDSALCIESGNADRYRPLVVVSCPFEMQLERLMKRNGLTAPAARNIISKQLSSEEKVKYADFIIESIGTLNELEQKTSTILSAIKVIASRKN